MGGFTWHNGCCERRVNVALYQSSAAMSANLSWHDLISQNLAGQSSPGYRAQIASFDQFRVPGVPGTDPQMTSSYPVFRAQTLHEQGEVKPTGGKNDLSLDGPGFFSVRMQDGTVAYTRDGEFQIDSAGSLKTKDGGLVMGDAGPIRLDPTAGPIAVNPQGEVSQGGGTKGVLKIVEFKDRGTMQHLSGSYYRPGGTSRSQVPQRAATTQIQQGFLEGSNANSVVEMGNLLMAMRHFEANQHVLQTADERMGKSIQEIGAPPV